MLKKVFFLLSLWFGLMNVGYGQQTEIPLTTLLENLHTMQADFSQTAQAGNASSNPISTGQMALQRPGLFRWEVFQPNQQLIIADGQSLWVYDKDLQQVTQQKQNILSNDSPGALLSATVENLSQRFKIERLSTTPHEQSFLLTPKSKRTTFQCVILSFQKGTLQQMTIHDHFGQTTQIQFSHIKTNRRLPEAFFRFKAPPNVDIVRG